MYRMLVMDLDGTLLNSDKAVSPENARAVARARQMGLKVVVATGRPPIGTRQAQASLGQAGVDYLITYNGALTEELASGQTIALHTITVADYLDVAAFAQTQNLFCYCFAKTACLTPEPHETPDLEGRVNGIDVQLIDFTQIDPREPLVKIMVTGRADELDRCQASVPPALARRFMVARSAPILLEFMHPQASKGQAVGDLAGRLGIRREEIICIGDSGNDVDMIRFAGLGVAMGNATAEVRIAADYVTLACDDHGVAHALGQFLV